MRSTPLVLAAATPLRAETGVATPAELCARPVEIVEAGAFADRERDELPGLCRG